MEVNMEGNAVTLQDLTVFLETLRARYGGKTVVVFIGQEILSLRTSNGIEVAEFPKRVPLVR
jgi:hypothetical protein